MSIYSRRSHGELLIDHRASPGINEQDRMRLWRSGHIVPCVPEGQAAEFKTKRCAHCGGVVALVMTPFQNSHPGHCYKCDKFICKPCAMVGDCRPIEALADALVGSDKPLSPFSPLLIRSKVDV